jgi:hypothetical protein
MSYSDYVRGGSTKPTTSTQKAFVDDGFTMDEFYGKTVKPVQAQTFVDDGFTMDEFYGKTTKPAQVKQKVFEDDGLSYQDYVRGGVKPQT